MSESDYPAGAFHNSDAPFNQKSLGDCNVCDGDGEVCYTCNEIKSECTCDPDDQVLFNCSYCQGTGEKSEQQAQDEYESFKEDTNEDT